MCNFSHHILDSVGALCYETDLDPVTAVKPFDKNRRGTVQADGGAMLVLESEKSAIKRGAKIIAEIKGYESGSIADHIYKPNKLGV